MKPATAVPRDELISLLMANPKMTYREAGQLFGVSRQRVHQIAKKAGLRRRNPGRHRADITAERVLELFNQGMLIKDIAKALGCCIETVTVRLREAGVSKSECYSHGKRVARRG